MYTTACFSVYVPLLTGLTVSALLFAEASLAEISLVFGIRILILVGVAFIGVVFCGDFVESLLLEMGFDSSVESLACLCIGSGVKCCIVESRIGQVSRHGVLDYVLETSIP